MGMKIALAGNPNCGKTTLFNALTGASQHVGNWPGVTVEKKEGKLRGHGDVIIQDLPGVYSLSPYTLEEVVTRDYLVTEQPDAILNIIDASNLERNLYLTTQLMELGLPVVIALNMMDVVRRQGGSIQSSALSQALGVPVIEISALKGEKCVEAALEAVRAAKSRQAAKPVTFGKDIEHALEQIGMQVSGHCQPSHNRWYAVKLFERDARTELPLGQMAKDTIEAYIKTVEDAQDDDAESIITNARYECAAKLAHAAGREGKAHKLTGSDKIDQIVTNRWLGFPIFVGIMFLVYYLSISTVGTMMTDWVNDVLFGEIIPPAVEGWLAAAATPEWLNGLVLDGIVAGVGSVLGFLPQMMVLFLCLAFLEDCGYMARIAFLMDRIFRRFGLSGKSFIPMLIGTGCGVPGIMASRTIENQRDRRMTVITTTFIPCSAKLPVIALIAGALFGGAWWVGPSAYFVGVAAIICSGIILKKTRLFVGDPAPFVMELPAYHWPSLKGVLRHMWERAVAFIKKAGTVIFLAVTLIWFLQTFNFRLEMVEQNESILASIGNVLAPIFAPLGWGDWRAAVAAISGLIAKENVVGTLGVLFGFAEVAEDGVEIWGTMQQVFTPVAAYSFLVFNLLCAPCFAAIGAVRRELGGKWTLIAVGYQCLLAYMVSLCIYQFGALLTGAASFGVGTVAAIIILVIFLYLLFRPQPKPESKLRRAAVKA
ncbi:MAG: ferrous iron transport protein B [Butyricicoccus pullicaecorum]|nr:ferrous iron transport protein B [Butyricicoccus pullicaecorum]